MTNPNVGILQDLLQVARDSKTFYESAADAVENPVIAHEFRRMADIKGKLIDELAMQINARGEFPETGGTFAGSLRKAYADLLVALGEKKAYTYSAQLEETEDRLLKHFEKALADTQSTLVREVLMRQLPRMRRCHDEMLRLKTALAA